MATLSSLIVRIKIGFTFPKVGEIGRYSCLPVILSLTSLCAQPHWEWLNPLPQGNNLHAVHFPSENTGYAVGAGGAIIKTTDGGATWSVLNSGTNIFLRDVHFFDNQKGMIVGDGGYLLKTTNGGMTWSRQQLATGPFTLLRDIFFLGPDTGFIGGISPGIIFKTVDGGNTWSSDTLGGPESLNRVHSLFFLNASKGFAVGKNTSSRSAIFRTLDGGNTWDTTVFNYQEFNSVHFPTPDTGYATLLNGGKIFKTVDGGNSWDSLNVVPRDALMSVYFLSADTGFLCGDFYFLKTTNGGATWIVDPDVRDKAPIAISFANKNVGYAVGTGGLIRKTLDGGRTWTVLSRGSFWESWESIHFADNLHGAVAGEFGSIFRTGDGGITWDSASVDTVVRLADIFFPSVSTGYAVGRGGVILKSTDTGKTWVSQYSRTDRDLYGVHFTDTSHGCVVGDSGTILKTNNGGRDWSFQQTDPPFNLRHVRFTGKWPNDDALIGYAAGWSDGIFKTLGGGSIWYYIPNNFLTGYYDMDFPTPDTGYALAWIGSDADNSILKTTNGGFTFNKKPTGVRASAFHFLDKNNGYMVGSNGSLYKTVNGAESWTSISPVTNMPLIDVHCLDTTSCFVAGAAHAAILKYTSGNSVPVKGKKRPVQDGPISLGASGELLYRLPRPGKVVVSLMDIQGRLVKKLFEGNQRAGEHKFRLPSGKFPPGSYILDLQTESYRKAVRVDRR